MTDQNANLKGYSYHEMSSKVEQADRSLLRSRAHEPTGEVESLRGRNDVGRMGDRLTGVGGGQKHARPSELLRDKQKKKKPKKQQQPDDYRSRRSENIVVASAGRSILDMENLTGYQPTTQTARTAYENILVSVSNRLTTWADVDSFEMRLQLSLILMVFIQLFASLYKFVLRENYFPTLKFWTALQRYALRQ